jgi:hypothetical protein
MNARNRSRDIAKITAAVYRAMAAKGLSFSEAWTDVAHNPDTAELFNAMERPSNAGRIIVPPRFSSDAEWNALHGGQRAAGSGSHAGTENVIL